MHYYTNQNNENVCQGINSVIISLVKNIFSFFPKYSLPNYRYVLLYIKCCALGNMVCLKIFVVNVQVMSWIVVQNEQSESRVQITVGFVVTFTYA